MVCLEHVMVMVKYGNLMGVINYYDGKENFTLNHNVKVTKKMLEHWMKFFKKKLLSFGNKIL